jgi:alpha-galactosidase
MSSTVDFSKSARTLPRWVTGIALVSASLGAVAIMGMPMGDAQTEHAATRYYWIGAVAALVFVGVVWRLYYGFNASSLPKDTLTALLIAVVALPVASSVRDHASAAEASGPPADLSGAWMDLARTPPMGWNSWNHFFCDINDALIRQTADAIVASGMRDAGYRFVVIDGCWQGSRDAAGNIVPDAKKFPSGMKAVADYVHSKGLKFGLYSDAGSKACDGSPGSLGYEDRDARQYAAWGVDYLKYDWCYTDGVDPKIAYTTMRDALRATGRPIIFSMCEWGLSHPWTWARGVGHMWRTTPDILPCWDCTGPSGQPGGWSLILDAQVGLEKYAAPGGWNDPDTLEVGNYTVLLNGRTYPGFSPVESRAHFSFWALLAAPLMAGNDVRQMPPDVRDVLLNRDVIAVDQDPLGIQGNKVRDDGDMEVWAKPLVGNSHAVILFNRGSAPATIMVSWPELGLPQNSAQSVRDLWQQKDLGLVTGAFTATVMPHDVAMIKVG